MPNSAEPHIAALIRPEEYLHHFNQVATFSPTQVEFLKRKFFSKIGWELIAYPMADCERVIYRDERPILNMIAGVLLLLLLGFIGVMVFMLWGKFESPTLVPIGLLALAGLYGFRLAFASRRHRLCFIMRDGKELEFKSRSGDFKTAAPVVLHMAEYLRGAGKLRDAE